MSHPSLLNFVQEMSRMLQGKPAEPEILTRGTSSLANLVANDNWLPEVFTRPHPHHYQQYLLYADPLELFSIVSFVWGPGQKTPVHNHMSWGLIGMLRGKEVDTHYH